MKLMTSCTQNAALALLRVVSAYTFLLHGTSKLLSIPTTQISGVDLFSLFGLAGVLEIVGGLLLLLGLFTRPVAFLLAGEMAVAYFTAHAKIDNFFFPLVNGGESAVLFCFIFLYLFVADAGCFSLDHKIRQNKEKNILS